MIRAALLLVLASAWLSTARASAQWVDVSHEAPVETNTETLRLAVGGGASAVVAGDYETNGSAVHGDGPTSLPMPSLVARIDYPAHAHLLLGVQSSLFLWQDFGADLFGDTGHVTLGTSAVARLRFAFGTRVRHEILAWVPFGPTFDFFGASPRSYGASLDNNVGWHAGFAVGYQMVRKKSPWNWFGEIGFTWYRIPKTYSYQLEPERRAIEELIYQPVEVFIRAGGMLLPFR